MGTNVLSALLIVFIMLTFLFLVLFIINNKKYQTILTGIKEKEDQYNKLYSVWTEDVKVLRSYEITVDNYENLITKVSDELPKKLDAKSLALKLADELAPYFNIDEENGTVSINIYRGTA